MVLKLVWESREKAQEKNELEMERDEQQKQKGISKGTKKPSEILIFYPKMKHFWWGKELNSRFLIIITKSPTVFVRSIRWIHALILWLKSYTLSMPPNICEAICCINHFYFRKRHWKYPFMSNKTFLPSHHIFCNSHHCLLQEAL